MTAPRQYTPLDKINECERELRMRRQVYPGMLDRAPAQRRAWLEAQQKEQIAVLEQIAEDYRALVAGDPGPLFRVKDEHEEQTA